MKSSTLKRVILCVLLFIIGGIWWYFLANHQFHKWAIEERVPGLRYGDHIKDRQRNPFDELRHQEEQMEKEFRNMEKEFKDFDDEIDFEDNSKYHVTIGLSKFKKLKLTVTELSKYNNIYEAKFDHEELIAIDKFFGLYDKIEDIVREMDNLFTKNCISISMDMAHSVIFSYK